MLTRDRESLLALLIRHSHQHLPALGGGDERHPFDIDPLKTLVLQEGARLAGWLGLEALNQLELELGLDFDAIAGLGVEAVPLLMSVASKAYDTDRELHVIIVRDEAKEHGTQARLEGNLAAIRGHDSNPRRICVFANTLATAAEALIPAAIVDAHDQLYTKGIITLVDFLEAERAGFERAGVVHRSIFDRNDFPT